jgi:hypothetical protein
MLPLSELPPCLGLPQHSNQYSPERPVLLAVDQELGASGVAASSAEGQVKTRGMWSFGTTVPPRGLIRPSPAVGPGAAGFAFSTGMGLPPSWNGAGVSIDRTGDGRVVPSRSTIVRHDRRRRAMVLMRFP